MVDGIFVLLFDQTQIADGGQESLFDFFRFFIEAGKTVGIKFQLKLSRLAFENLGFAVGHREAFREGLDRCTGENELFFQASMVGLVRSRNGNFLPERG